MSSPTNKLFLITYAGKLEIKGACVYCGRQRTVKTERNGKQHSQYITKNKLQESCRSESPTIFQTRTEQACSATSIIKGPRATLPINRMVGFLPTGGSLETLLS